MKSNALFAFSADPIHFGHIDIIKRAAKQFNLTVLVASNPTKNYFFVTAERRANLVRQTIKRLKLENDVTVAELPRNKLVVDYAYEQGISVVIRGVRSFSDFDFEKLMCDVNATVQAGIETLLLPGDPSCSHISSTAVKELFSHQGFIHEYVPLWVKDEMERLNHKTIIGVTGGIACGKNWLCEQFRSEHFFGSNCTEIDLDKIAHEILFTETGIEAHRLVCEMIRCEILHDMPNRFRSPLDAIERKELGELVFSKPNERMKLNDIMRPAILTALRQAISKAPGAFIFINAALLAEFNLLHICNNNVVLVSVDPHVQYARLNARGLTPTQIKHRLQSQYTTERKEYHINKAIQETGYGKLVQLDTTTAGLREVGEVFSAIIYDS